MQGLKKNKSNYLQLVHYEISPHKKTARKFSRRFIFIDKSLVDLLPQCGQTI